MAGKSKQQKEVEVTLNKKDAKKVAKLEAMIPYHAGRGQVDEVSKIQEQIAQIWTKTREAAYAV